MISNYVQFASTVSRRFLHYVTHDHQRVRCIYLLRGDLEWSFDQAVKFQRVNDALLIDRRKIGRGPKL